MRSYHRGRGRKHGRGRKSYGRKGRGRRRTKVQRSYTVARGGYRM